MSRGITLDTGALIALERRRDRMLRLLRASVEQRLPVTVPVVVLAEWWRSRTELTTPKARSTTLAGKGGAAARSQLREVILASMLVEPMDERLGRTAGAALAAVRGATAIDAIVMASAARRDDVVLTSDVEDMTRLAAHFRSVRVLGV